MKKIKKITLTVATACVLTAAIPAVTNQYGVSDALAQASVPTLEDTAKVLELNSEYYQVKTNIPVLTSMKDTSFQQKLNETIESKTMDLVKEVQREATKGAQQADEEGYEFHPYVLDVSHEIKSTGDDNLLSIVVETYLYMGGAHGVTIIDTYNVVDDVKTSHVTLEQLLGPDYKVKTRDAVLSAFEKEPYLFYDETSEFELDDEQSFYVKDGEVVLIFGQSEIAPPPAGILEIPVQN
ncbi:DUF4163 domain-containing protein [Halalkalibacterium halodurans]|uniref:DUF3298 and DUF4163 domain-containing protein n=1 Tax=Halalkalibacterium halodurans TaxID=86665 RepID=UPI002AAA4169|nr:DUF4163 domain-containing protein [Halalkalibacterium halodurans]MDY7224409.1 DUF4163 domain-containing protein [Halalkalibacterium halodurans]MDY7243694.1 DUF4163 domain-containing protein [Halalkalibacterium halodurans]MED4079614.1 DUF4163 domain-containing protein [Halalkalibacterium halodurans]MED4084109.1 DUF4163 domain-containing protein [Halalkalibacterium halodurans]MED4104587.1 DUF4163 domain-containing protein [Halalkalibacterium halodurans]